MLLLSSQTIYRYATNIEFLRIIPVCLALIFIDFIEIALSCFDRLVH